MGKSTRISPSATILYVRLLYLLFVIREFAIAVTEVLGDLKLVAPCDFSGLRHVVDSRLNADLFYEGPGTIIELTAEH